MSENVIGKIPEFASDETTPVPEVKSGTEEVKQAPLEKEEEKEKEIPAELPAVEKPAEQQVPSVDTGELLKQMQGLQVEREKLLTEIQTLRGTRRELKQDEIQKVEQKMDDLKDVHPEDVAIIDRIMSSRGVMSAEKVNQMFYKYVQEDEKNKFLEKYPEYKPENDPNDLNWNALQRELGFYRKPEDPHLIGELLLRAHRGIQKAPSDLNIAAKKRQAEIAGVGAGGTQKSSSHGKLSSQQRQQYEQGGWSEEEIKKIEENLPE